MSVEPYFETDLGKLYHGDCREILLELEPKVIITDPVWPNTTEQCQMQGRENPEKLFREMFNSTNGNLERVAVHLGCNSDPRFLAAIPINLEFFRVVYLEYIRPHYMGRLMYNSDVGYLFGIPPRSGPGKRVIPGYIKDTDNKVRQINHPCPRKIGHVKWLVHWWSEDTDTVVDPFAGSGTTPVVCEMLRRKWLAIEVVEQFCEEAARRLELESQQLKWC